jgi:hypothetical protein
LQKGWFRVTSHETFLQRMVGFAMAARRYRHLCHQSRYHCEETVCTDILIQAEVFAEEFRKMDKWQKWLINRAFDPPRWVRQVMNIRWSWFSFVLGMVAGGFVAIFVVMRLVRNFFESLGGIF